MPERVRNKELAGEMERRDWRWHHSGGGVMVWEKDFPRMGRYAIIGDNLESDEDGLGSDLMDLEGDHVYSADFHRMDNLLAWADELDHFETALDPRSWSPR
jgi:hypothetical protein